MSLYIRYFCSTWSKLGTLLFYFCVFLFNILFYYSIYLNIVISLILCFLVAVKFTTRPMNITVEEGKSLWVHCRGSGSPKPEIFYLRDKANGGNLSQSHYIRFANGSMNIKNVKREDVGSVGYMCWLKNEYSSVYATFWITLTGMNFRCHAKKHERSLQLEGGQSLPKLKA